MTFNAPKRDYMRKVPDGYRSAGFKRWEQSFRKALGQLDLACRGYLNDDDAEGDTETLQLQKQLREAKKSAHNHCDDVGNRLITTTMDEEKAAPLRHLCEAAESSLRTSLIFLKELERRIRPPKKMR